MLGLICTVFVGGYLAIACESFLRINKTAVALLVGVLSWTIFAFFSHSWAFVLHELTNHLSSISEILFFLMGAMTIVEVISAHNGFDFLVRRIHSRNKRVLLWQLSWLAFFLSAILDNLTTAIVMISLAQKLVPDKRDRWIVGAMIVIAANAGGAWSPIGDVTTTMLWIGGQVSAMTIVKRLFLPSVVCLFVPLLVQSYFFSGTYPVSERRTTSLEEPYSIFIFALGLGILFFVPLFKMITHMPPYIGMLMGLSLLWIVSDILHGKKGGRDHLRIERALSRIDMSSILFFLGILLAVSVLEATHVLSYGAAWLDHMLPSKVHVVISLGFLSSIIDNVPLVAASMGMYPLLQFPMDHVLWEMIAFASGTGGSILIIGSAPGIVFMGMESVSFGWYLRRVSLLASLGFIAGFGVYLAILRFLL